MEAIRTCIVCRKKDKKSNFVRIVSDINGNAIYDKTQKCNSRGIYFCKDNKCIEKAFSLLDKNKLNCKISLRNDSLRNILKDVENELGE